jgi:hypothetical protein
MATIACKLAMCISRLVEFELILELKIEQKHGTSLIKLVLLRRKSASRLKKVQARSEWIRALYSPYITGTDRRSVCNPDFLRDETSLSSEVPSFC